MVKFGVNCTECDAACDGCTGPGPENCDSCGERHYYDDDGVCKRTSTSKSSSLSAMLDFVKISV